VVGALPMPSGKKASVSRGGPECPDGHGGHDAPDADDLQFADPGGGVTNVPVQE